MFICEIWLFDWYFPQFCTSDMSKYGYLEITIVDCSLAISAHLVNQTCILQLQISRKKLNRYRSSSFRAIFQLQILFNIIPGKNAKSIKEANVKGKNVSLS